MSYSLKEALKELNSEGKKVNEDLFEPAILNKVKTATFENISLSWLWDILSECDNEGPYNVVYLYIGHDDPNEAKYTPITVNEQTFNSIYEQIKNAIKQPSGNYMVRLHSRLLHAIIDNDYLFIYVNPGEVADMYC